MKKILLLLFCTIALNLNASSSDSTKFEIHIIDYSLSWTSAMHYYLDNKLRIQEVDNIDKKNINVLVNRPLLSTEIDVIKQYLEIFLQIELLDEYVSRFPVERNQKRINIKYGNKNKSFFISNTYQQDIAGLISFLNTNIPEQHKMKEFVDPNKPIKKK